MDVIWEIAMRASKFLSDKTECLQEPYYNATIVFLQLHIPVDCTFMEAFTVLYVLL